MRIGTWNLAGRWDQRHADLLATLDCDALLLTEVSERVAIPSYTLHLSTARMAPRRRWAAVATRAPLEPQADPHPASAMAVSQGWTLCSSILPWRSCGGAPWRGHRHADRTRAALDELLANLPRARLVWGGDWNHALSGREHAGSVAGRVHVLAAVDALGLVVPTAQLPHAIAPMLAIDHIAVPADATTSAAAAVVATADGERLSDHDAYVVTLG
jgi:hypothetical protein